MMAGIRLVDVTKRFGDTIAVREMNLDVKDGELVVFLGPSGCGKTTTLRSIAGLEHPEEGDIFIDDVRVNHLRPADRDIAFVFQFYALYPHLTVYENIAFPLRAIKLDKQETDTRVRNVARILHIADHLDRKPSRLSGGEMQRVALGRAMVRRPKVFLMDEPLTNLDAKLRVEMRAELKHLQNKLGTTTIYVTHDQVEAMSLGDRIAVMKDGELQQIGPTEEVYHQPANLFVAGFMGSPPMNLLPVQLHQDGQLQIEHTPIKFPLLSEARRKIRDAQQELILGIRPENISLDHQHGDFEAPVHLVEPLGSDTLVDLLLGQSPESRELVLMKVRVLPTFQVHENQKLWMALGMEHIHLSDRKTGKIVWRNRKGVDYGKVPGGVISQRIGGTCRSNH